MKILKPTEIFYLMAVLLVISLFKSADVLARGGGGGSGGGGGGGGGGGRGVGGLIYVIVLIISAIVAHYARKKRIAAAKLVEQNAEQTDSTWKEDLVVSRVKEVFFSFQKAWSDLSDTAMKPLLTEDYFRRMVLELNVLARENRKNDVQNPRIISINILEAHDEADNSKDYFVAEVIGQARDVLLDTATNKTLYVDSNSFTEYWQFKRVGDQWFLGEIKQATESPSQTSFSLKNFAEKNNFYYDADFGWLMMPNKGVLFKRTNFLTSDINNHIIGYFRKTIVEFYTFLPSARSQMSNHYLVAQAILPISYNNILVKRKKWFNFSPWGLRRIELESVDFNKRFCLWADPRDQVSSLELLTTNFMQKIFDLPFEVNIEIVGNFLYFYRKHSPVEGYDQMLEILTWAFDEMKM